MGNRHPTAMEIIARHHADLSGKVALVTGCTSGMGIEIARALASAHTTVFITGRNAKELEKVAEELNAELKSRGEEARVKPVLMDLSSLRSVRTGAAEFLRRSTQLHLLICNAGLMNVPNTPSTEGADMQMAVNHIAHQLLFSLLQPAMLASIPSRLVVVSSNAWHAFGPAAVDYTRLPSVNSAKYSGVGAYQQSKLANVLFALHVNATSADRGLTAYSLDPGVVRSGLQVGIFVLVVTLASPFLKSVQQGAATAVYCGVAPGIEANSGEFFDSCAVTNEVSKRNVTREDAKRLWDWTNAFIEQHAAQK